MLGLKYWTLTINDRIGSIHQKQHPHNHVFCKLKRKKKKKKKTYSLSKCVHTAVTWRVVLSENVDFALGYFAYKTRMTLTLPIVWTMVVCFLRPFQHYLSHIETMEARIIMTGWHTNVNWIPRLAGLEPGTSRSEVRSYPLDHLDASNKYLDHISCLFQGDNVITSSLI